MNSRNYNFKDIEMLMACRTVTTNLINNLDDLSLVRSNWTTEYTTDLQTRIDNAIEQFLGLDKNKELRNATAVVESIQKSAKREISMLKTQIEVDFPSTKNELLKSLGFNANYREVQNNSQEAMILLLYAFKKGMTDELKAKMVDKGTNPVLIEKIVSYANQLKEADLTQETLKKSSTVISGEALAVFNNIYNECIGICKIASVFYQDDQVKKVMFTFSKIVAAMRSGGK